MKGRMGVFFVFIFVYVVLKKILGFDGVGIVLENYLLYDKI